MKSGYENEFMKIQSGLISLCLEGVSTKVDKVYAYAYIGKGSSMFNVFFESNRTILQANKAIDSSLVPQVLRLGTEDLEKLRKLCIDYETKCPVEIKMYYDCETKKYHADCKYDYEEYCRIYKSPQEHFVEWRNEVLK